MKKSQALIFSLTSLCTCIVPVVVSGCTTTQVVAEKAKEKGRDGQACGCSGHDQASGEGCSCKGDTCGCGAGTCSKHS